MEKDNLPVFFYYWDSDLLEKSLPDKVDRSIALFFLANLQPAVYDRDTYEVVRGIKAMELFVDRLPQMYDWIVNAWKNPDCEEYRDVMEAYKMWLQDRYVHGMVNTVRQFSGEWPFQQEGTIDDFLNKNFFAWKFAKFPYAYLSGRTSYGPNFNLPNHSEAVMYAFELPLAYKSVGIPLGEMDGINAQAHIGLPADEYAIFGIPESAIEKLLSQKDLGRVIVAPGNGISVISAVDGFEKDSLGDSIFVVLREFDDKIYLWVKK